MLLSGRATWQRWENTTCWRFSYCLVRRGWSNKWGWRWSGWVKATWSQWATLWAISWWDMNDDEVAGKSWPRWSKGACCLWFIMPMIWWLRARSRPGLSTLCTTLAGWILRTWSVVSWVSWTVTSAGCCCRRIGTSAVLQKIMGWSTMWSGVLPCGLGDTGSCGTWTCARTTRTDESVVNNRLPRILTHGEHWRMPHWKKRQPSFPNCWCGRWKTKHHWRRCSIVSARWGWNLWEWWVEHPVVPDQKTCLRVLLWSRIHWWRPDHNAAPDGDQVECEHQWWSTNPEAVIIFCVDLHPLVLCCTACPCCGLHPHTMWACVSMSSGVLWIDAVRVSDSYDEKRWTSTFVCVVWHIARRHRRQSLGVHLVLVVCTRGLCRSARRGGLVLVHMHDFVWTRHREFAVALCGFIGERIKNPVAITFVTSRCRMVVVYFCWLTPCTCWMRPVQEHSVVLFELYMHIFHHSEVSIC